MAYHACNQVQRDMYNELDVPPVDIQICRESLFKIIKTNTVCGGYDALGDRRFLFTKVQLVVQYTTPNTVKYNLRFAVT
ncbi:hypothetical protein ACI65C_000980 [Semiaphis heraclei]